MRQRGHIGRKRFSMRIVPALLAMFLIAVPACSLLDPDHPPCPSSDPPAPGPGAPPDTGDPTDPGDYGASGERYRKLKDGTVCVCGAYEIGCYETEEGADASMACAYGPEGRECEPYALPPSPGADTMQYFNCYYEKLDRQTKSTEDKSRSQKAKDLVQADRLHGEWCDSESDRQDRYVYTPRGCK
jgi:hypothetical protein